MGKLILGCILVLFSTLASAAGTSIHLDDITTDHSDKPSLQRGAKLFTNYCMGCHSMEYARYKRVSQDLEIPEDLYTENLIFTDAKIGELMKIAMPKDKAGSWFGNPPPDLTLETRLRGDDWVYSYLRGFYQDQSRPLGVNNVVFPNVGMPHVLVNLQGLCAEHPTIGEKAMVDPLSGDVRNAGSCSKFAIEGSLTGQEYDQVVYDITNFMSYMADPIKLERESLGIKVLLFIPLFFVCAWFLNREYWKDVH